MSNQEKVARAAFPFVVMPPRGWTDGERQAYEDGGRWTEGQEAARKVRSTDLATAAIDALADVDGIARAVADAQGVPFVGPRQRKIAAAVVAWMKDAL